jgi:hypothetical protein
LSQVLPKKVTSAAAGTSASTTLRSGASSAPAKTAAGSALTQRPPQKRR